LTCSRSFELGRGKRDIVSFSRRESTELHEYKRQKLPVGVTGDVRIFLKLQEQNLSKREIEGN